MWMSISNYCLQRAFFDVFGILPHLDDLMPAAGRVGRQRALVFRTMGAIRARVSRLAVQSASRLYAYRTSRCCSAVGTRYHRDGAFVPADGDRLSRWQMAPRS